MGRLLPKHQRHYKQVRLHKAKYYLRHPVVSRPYKVRLEGLRSWPHTNDAWKEDYKKMSVHLVPNEKIKCLRAAKVLRRCVCEDFPIEHRTQVQEALENIWRKTAQTGPPNQ